MWFKWLLTALLALEIIGRIFQIDEPRAKVSRAEAIGQLLFNAALIYGILYYFK